MSRAVCPQLITLARESRDLTQQELADAMGVSQGKLSKYENGMLEVTEEDASALVNALHYTKEFFLQDSEVLGPSSSCIYHRKKSRMPLKQLRAIHAQINILRMQVPRLSDGVEVDTTKTLHPMDVDEFGGPVKVARELRRLWKIPVGPIRNLTGTIERAGCVLWKMRFGTRQIDALSQIIDGYPPVFLINSESPGDRLRFTLAHELGHSIMHQRYPSSNQEREADEFASEFLMPGEEIGPDLNKLSFEKLPVLKGHWRVSMAAIIKRATDLGRISERHSRSLFTQLSKHGWRTKEPYEIEMEEPTVLRDILRVQLYDNTLSIPELANAAFLTRSTEFQERFMKGDEPHLRVVG